MSWRPLTPYGKMPNNRCETLLGDPPMREFTRVIELIGPRGGVIYVLLLTCKHWITRRKLPKVLGPEVPCVGCLVEAALKEREAKR